MGRMLRYWILGMLVAGLSAVGHAWAGESVVLRTATGRLLRLAEDGSLQADRLVPGPPETFTLRPGHNGQLTIQAGTGAAPWFLLVPREGNQVAVRKPIGELHPEQSAELYRLGHIPTLIQEEFGRLIRKAVVEELGGEGYDKVRIRKKQRFVKVPAPTLRDWKRQKQRRVLSMDEEYQVHVQLSGDPEIKVVDMPYLQGYYDAAVGALMFTVQATLPLDGQVRYRIPDVMSASTGFRTVVSLTAAGEVRSTKENGQVTLHVPELLELNVGIRELDISNDALNLLHEPLEDLINDELREKNDRIREKANRSIQKAVDSQKFRSPMLEWLLMMPLK